MNDLAKDAELACLAVRRLQTASHRRILIIKIANRVHRWRFLTGERRAELILLLDDLLADVDEDKNAQLRADLEEIRNAS